MPTLSCWREEVFLLLVQMALCVVSATVVFAFYSFFFFFPSHLSKEWICINVYTLNEALISAEVDENGSVVCWWLQFFLMKTFFFFCNFFLFVLASGWSGGKRVMLLSWENWRIVAALLLNCKSLTLSLLICEMGILLSALPKSRGCWEVLLSSVNRLTWILCRCCLQ